ncbi:hypothetical protein WJX73_002064 [Symbiochloris irregularis]|uniref:Uncharacterized protein n=1 Tax=Symbiochloris irregularis TaxID=706552 RepID=A0AAW1PWB1_9CHLO
MGVLPKEDDGHRFAGINDLTFSKGSKMIAIACEDATVQVWDLKTQARRYVLGEHASAVTCVCFSPSDQFIASASTTGAAWLHEALGGHPIRQVCQGVTPRKNSVHVSSLEPLVASAAEDGCIHVWDAEHPKAGSSYRLHRAPATGACFSPASPLIVVSAGLDSRVCLLDRRTQVDQITEVLPGAPLSSITCRDDGTSIVVGTTGGDVLLYDPRRLNQPLVRKGFGTEEIKSLHWQNAARKKSASASASTSQSLPSPSERGAPVSASIVDAPAAPSAAAHEVAAAAAPDEAAVAAVSPAEARAEAQPGNEGWPGAHHDAEAFNPTAPRSPSRSRSERLPNGTANGGTPAVQPASAATRPPETPPQKASVPSSATQQGGDYHPFHDGDEVEEIGGEGDDMQRWPDTGQTQALTEGGAGKQQLGTSNRAKMLAALAGNGAHDQGSASPGAVNDKLMGLQEDVRRLHLEMIRQFTINQVDFTEAFQTVIQQQNMLIGCCLILWA